MFFLHDEQVNFKHVYSLWTTIINQGVLSSMWGVWLCPEKTVTVLGYWISDLVTARSITLPISKHLTSRQFIRVMGDLWGITCSSRVPVNVLLRFPYYTSYDCSDFALRPRAKVPYSSTCPCVAVDPQITLCRESWLDSQIDEDNLCYHNSIKDRRWDRILMKSMAKPVQGLQRQETSSLGLLGLSLAQACMPQVRVGWVCEGILLGKGLALSEQTTFGIWLGCSRPSG